MSCMGASISIVVRMDVLRVIEMVWGKDKENLKKINFSRTVCIPFCSHVATRISLKFRVKSAGTHLSLVLESKIDGSNHRLKSQTN